MTQRPCIRCHHLLTLEGGQLVYCSACGAPQIFLSEALQEQVALETQHYHDQAAAAAAAPSPEEAASANATPSRFAALRRVSGAGKGRWPLAVSYALLSSAIALALDLGGILFSPLMILAWLWIVSAPMLTVSFYSSKARADRISPGFAARLGLLTGVLVTVSCAVVFTVALVLARFALHSSVIDAQMAAIVAQLHTQYGNTAAPMLHLLTIPEFRVGLLLWTFTFTSGIYLALSTITAGFAGILLGRRRPA